MWLVQSVPHPNEITQGPDRAGWKRFGGGAAGGSISAADSDHHLPLLRDEKG